MIRKWRFKTSSYNCWYTFELTSEHYRMLEKVNAKIFPLAEMILFQTTEDMVVFRLQAEINDTHES